MLELPGFPPVVDNPFEPPAVAYQFPHHQVCTGSPFLPQLTVHLTDSLSLVVTRLKTPFGASYTADDLTTVGYAVALLCGRPAFTAAMCAADIPHLQPALVVAGTIPPNTRLGVSWLCNRADDGTVTATPYSYSYGSHIPGDFEWDEPITVNDPGSVEAMLEIVASTPAGDAARRILGDTPAATLIDLKEQI